MARGKSSGVNCKRSNGSKPVSKHVSPKGNKKGSKVSPTQKDPWYNVNSLAALALLLVNTRTTFLNFLTKNASDKKVDDKTLKHANEWAGLKYDDAKYAVVKNIDKLAESDKQIKTLISDSAINMHISAQTEQSLHASVITALFGEDFDSLPPQKNTDQVQSPKNVAFLKSPTKVIKTTGRPIKRKLDQSEPRPIRGQESDESPKRNKHKIVQDGEDPMPEVIYSDVSITTTPEKSTDPSIPGTLNSLEAMIVSQKDNDSDKSQKSKREIIGSSPSCTLPKNQTILESVTPPRTVKSLDLSATSQLNTPSPKHQSFDSSLEGLIQVTESNKKIVEQKKAKSDKPTVHKRSTGIKIRDPDSPSHCGNMHSESDDESPQNRILSSSAWPRDPHMASDAGMAWKMGGLFDNSSQAPGSSSKINSTPISEPMDVAPGTSKRKSEDVSPTPDRMQTKKQRNFSPPKISTPKSDTQPKNKSPPKRSNEKQNEKKSHAIPAFFFPRNVKNYGDFCTELAAKNPEIRNGFDLGTFKNGQKYIKPRTLQIANKFKSPLTAFGMLYDFTQVNSDQSSGHTIKVIKVPYSRNTCKNFDSNTDINWIRVVDIRNNPSGMRTCTLIMNFKNVAPPKVYIGSLAFSTHSHKPEPKRCTKCQHFGHFKKQCKRDTICTFCAGSHDSSICFQKKQNDEAINLKCSNCGGKHAASSKKCPVYTASVHSMQNEPSAQPTVPAPAPANKPFTLPVKNAIPSLLDLEVFPPLSRHRDSHLHIPYDMSFQHTYSGNIAITLHLLRQMQKEHPTAKLAIENLAFSIGGESFRDTIKK